MCNHFISGDIDKDMCEFKDDDDCIFFFSYNYVDGGKLRIRAQEEKGKHVPINIFKPL